MTRALAQDPLPAEPRTPEEESGYQRTSTHAEVLRFLDELRRLPHAERLHRDSLGESGEGKELPLIVAAEPPCTTPEAVRASGKLRILVNANIHAGEVEGKAAVMLLLREIARGEHADVLARAVLLFVPDFNPDGNDRIRAENRPEQNGPSGGVGTRANAAGLDLNRDFVKAESKEVRALLAAFERFDPHVFMDLHTTNGSYHGYHLTYAPSLAANLDPALARFAREELLPEVRGAMAARHGYRVFDYGNFPETGPDGWDTYDHRPRFGTNYVGLRNRLAILSEAYSYLDLEQRTAVTRAFVLECAAAVVRHARQIVAMCAAADRALTEPSPAAPELGFASELAPAVEEEVLVGSVRREGTRFVALPEFEKKRMPVRRSFRATRSIALPAAWVVADIEGVRAVLLAHGLVVERLSQGVTARVAEFTPTDVRRAARPFQGHRAVELAGEWTERETALPEGALVVRAAQRLGRVAAQLLEPDSEDSLATWNFFDAEAGDTGAHGLCDPYPVTRLVELPPDAVLTRVAPP